MLEYPDLCLNTPFSAKGKSGPFVSRTLISAGIPLIQVENSFIFSMLKLSVIAMAGSAIRSAVNVVMTAADVGKLHNQYFEGGNKL